MPIQQNTIVAYTHMYTFAFVYVYMLTPIQFSILNKANFLTQSHGNL